MPCHIKVWCFYRPYCSPSTGQVFAETATGAMRAVHLLYGFASDTKVSCVDDIIKEENNGNA